MREAGAWKLRLAARRETEGACWRHNKIRGPARMATGLASWPPTSRRRSRSQTIEAPRREVRNLSKNKILHPTGISISHVLVFLQVFFICRLWGVW